MNSADTALIAQDLWPAEREALELLAVQSAGLNAYEVGSDRMPGINRLQGRRLGRKKLVSQRVGRQGFYEWRITDAGREVLAMLAREKEAGNGR